MKNYKKLLINAEKKIEKIINNKEKLSQPLSIEEYVICSAKKSLRFCEAIIILCENKHSIESLPILRGLIENSINSRWIINKDTQNRLNNYLSDLSKNSFGEKWTQIDFFSRMRELNFPVWYYNFVVKYTYGHAHSNAKSVFSMIKSRPNFPINAIYAVSAQMLGHILKSFELIYPEFLKDNLSHNIWKKIDVAIT